MATSSRSTERFKYGICLNDECPMCKQKKVQQIPMRKDLVCQNPECGKPLRECPPPRKSGAPTGLIIGIIAFLLVGGLAGGGIWAYKSGLFDKISGKETPQQPIEDSTQRDGKEEKKQEQQPPEPVQPILIEELAIDTKDFTLNVGEKKTLACTATPADHEEAITWKSSDETIATVDAETGEVKAIKTGSANIMAQTDQSGISKSVTVTVKEKEKEKEKEKVKLQPSWGHYSGERNKSGKPHGQGVLTITSRHTINGEQALVGETITGVFKDGYLNMGKWNKLDGNVVIVKDLKIL